MFRKKKKTEILFAVLLERQNWELGEQIKGKILFRKDQPVKFSSIRARFVGTEQVVLSAAPDVPESKRTRSKVVFETPFVNVAERGSSPEGETEYSLHFLLPETLSPSFNVEGTAEVRYEVQTQLLLKSNSTPMESNVQVFIHPHLPTELPLSFVEKKEWGLISRESLSMRAVPDKALYEAGDQIVLDVTLDNKTAKKTIARILAGPEQSIRFGKRSEETNLGQIEVTSNLPIAPGTK